MVDLADLRKRAKKKAAEEAPAAEPAGTPAPAPPEVAAPAPSDPETAASSPGAEGAAPPKAANAAKATRDSVEPDPPPAPPMEAAPVPAEPASAPAVSAEPAASPSVPAEAVRPSAPFADALPPGLTEDEDGLIEITLPRRAPAPDPPAPAAPKPAPEAGAAPAKDEPPHAPPERRSVPRESVPAASPAPQPPHSDEERRGASKVPSAPPAVPAPAEAEIREYLTFDLGGEQYAIPIERIVEIVPHRVTTPVPNADSTVVGILSLRGVVVTVLDVRERLGGRSREVSADTRFVVLGLDKEMVGLLVDRVRRVLRFSSSDIEPPPSVGSHEGSDSVAGIVERGGKIIVVLDLDRLLDVSPAREGVA